MFSNTIRTVAFFRSIPHECMDVLFYTPAKKPASPNGTVRAGVQRGKVPCVSHVKWHNSHRSHTPRHIDSVHCTPYPAKINLVLDS